LRLFRHWLLKGQKRFGLDVQEPDSVCLEGAQMCFGGFQSGLIMTHGTDDSAPSKSRTAILQIVVHWKFTSGL
jgi:hypothetical protein